ncbi:MAG: hypothetical protein IKA71_06245 [Lentisphaeria bacterium]|nr:hypothetical protein [Lentisphaeria bacterium]
MNNFIFHRRHPEYAANERRWKRSSDAYSGGREYIEQALIRHVSEIDLEFAERRRRAYYFNYPRAIARRITQYALSVEPVRYNAGTELVEDWSRTGLSTNDVMRQLSTLLNVYGRAWLVVDMPCFTGTPSRAEARRLRLRPYVRALSPLKVVDWAYGNDGKLLWALTLEEDYHADDPFSPPVRVRRRRLYRRESWSLYENVSGTVKEIAGGVNPTGCVPLIPVVEPDGFGLAANHWFEDVVRISEAILNNESEAQMNTVKQMFGMLVVSDSFARSAQKISDAAGAAENFSATVARSAAIVESVDEKGISRYISPSGVTTSAIRDENRYLKQELYDIVGLAVQNSRNYGQSAESKAWDFQNISQFLAERAELLEQSELDAWHLMQRYDLDMPMPEIHYNRKFAVTDLASGIAGLLQLSEIPAGKAYHRAIGKTAVELLANLGGVGNEEKNRIINEIKEDKNNESEKYHTETAQ